MYGTNSNKGTFFQTEKAKEISSEKCVYGNFSQRVKDSRTESGFAYENWSIRFVGVACGKALASGLTDKTFIELTKWSIHNPYNKETERNEPYILCNDYNVVADSQNDDGAESSIDIAEIPFE